MTNFRFVKTNGVTLPYKYGNQIRIFGIFAFIVLASATAKTSAY